MATGGSKIMPSLYESSPWDKNVQKTAWKMPFLAWAMISWFACNHTTCKTSKSRYPKMLLYLVSTERPNQKFINPVYSFLGWTSSDPMKGPRNFTFRLVILFNCCFLLYYIPSIIACHLYRVLPLHTVDIFMAVGAKKRRWFFGNVYPHWETFIPINLF